jgi:hypothetical protein
MERRFTAMAASSSANCVYAALWLALTTGCAPAVPAASTLSAGVTEPAPNSPLAATAASTPPVAPRTFRVGTADIAIFEHDRFGPATRVRDTRFGVEFVLPGADWKWPTSNSDSEFFATEPATRAEFTELRWEVPAASAAGAGVTNCLQYAADHGLLTASLAQEVASPTPARLALNQQLSAQSAPQPAGSGTHTTTWSVVTTARGQSAATGHVIAIAARDRSCVRAWYTEKASTDAQAAMAARLAVVHALLVAHFRLLHDRTGAGTETPRPAASR